MELRQLRHFIAIVEEGTFVLAAQRVSITQPALSRSLQMLESTLKVRLIERGLRTSLPTEAGERFLPYARAILADCERARAALDPGASPAAQTLFVGIAPALSTWFSSTVDLALRRELPASAICLKEGNLPDLRLLLRDGRIHCALSVITRHDDDPGIAIEDLCPLHSVVVCARHVADRLTGRPSARALLTKRWAVIDGLDDHTTLYRQARRLNVAHPSVTLAGSLGRLRSLVLDEGYVALVPRQFLHEELDGGLLHNLDIELPVPTRQVALLHRTSPTMSPDISRIGAMLRRHLAAGDVPDRAPRVASLRTKSHLSLS